MGRPRDYLPLSAAVVWGSISAPWEIFAYAARNFENQKGVCCLELNNVPGLYFSTLRALNFAVMGIESTRSCR